MLRSLLISSLSFLTILTCSKKVDDKKVTEQTTASVSADTKTTVNTSQDIPVVKESPTEPPKKEETSTKPVKEISPKTTVTIPPKTTPTTSIKNTPTVTPPKSSAGRIAAPETLYFREGENKFLKNFEMNVTFRQITEDSRCPEGVNCIWEGVAVADVELMGTYTRPVTVKLATMNNESRGYKNYADFNGYRITLKSVTPYPTSAADSKSLQGKYKIGITIAPVNDKPKNSDGTTARAGATTR